MKFYRTLGFAAVLSTAITLAVMSSSNAAPPERCTLPDVARAPLSSAIKMGRVGTDDSVSVAVTLAVRNPAVLQGFLRRIENPSDPEYGCYLTPAQFAADFGPTEAQYREVAAFVESHGLTVTATHADRLILDVRGPRTAVESAFGVRLYWYRAQDGRIFHMPDRAPSIPVALANVVSGVVGLGNGNLRHGYLIPREAEPKSIGGVGIGTGPQGGLAPADIRAAYGVPASGLDGSGQTLAVFELDGYTPGDISGYEQEFGLHDTPLDNVLVDGATGTPGSGADEVTLDIEMQLALASGASKLMVYEAPNSDTGMLDGYAKIADDDAASEVSTSWGLAEPDNSTSFMQSENAIFEQMAAQGQTIFAAAGDYGAYDTGSKSDGLSVDDPGSQPYVCSAGGTTLTTASPGGPWAAETTWNTGSVQGGAGGGGSSEIWPIPSWQKGAITSASLASSTMRNVPDVSIDADPNTGYSVYFQGSWSVYGGTSCSGPLWAGLTALVNQQRVAAGKPVIGQAGPALYALLSGAGYSSEFHDIADGSTNLYYPAVTGYDDATGLGTPDGSALFAALESEAGWTGVKPTVPTGLTASAGVDSITLSWSAASGATSYDLYRSTVSGTGYASVGSSSAPGYTDRSVAAGTVYYYVVTAVDDAGQSAYSNQASATPLPAPASPPPAPTGLIATAGNGSVTLVWNASQGASAYNVYRAASGGTFAKIGAATAPAYTDTSVANGTTYDYAVTAVDAGGESAYGNVASATPAAPLPALATFPAGIDFISLPYGYPGVALSAVFGYSDPVLAVWNPSTSTYEVSPAPPANQIVLGGGYWVRFPAPVTVTLPGASASQSSPFSVALTTGWNQIGDPFPSAFPLSAIQVVQGAKAYSYDAAASAGLIGGIVYSYDPGSGSYTALASNASVAPYVGYWIEAYADVTLRIPPP